MKIHFNPLILGGFIIGAILLVVATLLTVGSRNPFRSKGHFVVYVADSAQGLDKGTGVSFKGVRIGQVSEIRLLCDRQTGRSVAALTCEVADSQLTDLQDQPIDLRDAQVLRALISEGLRAQVQTAGIVGAKFVDLDFIRSASANIPTGLPPSPFPVVPTVPSKMEALTQTASRIVENLGQADFAGIAQHANGVLAGIEGQVNELQTNRLTDHLSTAAESIGHLSTSTNLTDTITRFEEAAASLNLLLTNVNNQIAPLSSKIGVTLAQSKTALASINQTAQDFQDFLDLRNQLGEQTRAMVEQLTQTAQTLERLAGFLEQHPNALISGRAQVRSNP